MNANEEILNNITRKYAYDKLQKHHRKVCTSMNMQTLGDMQNGNMYMLCMNGMT